MRTPRETVLCAMVVQILASVPMKGDGVESRKELYIGGRWIAPGSGAEISVIDCRTEETMGSVPRGGRGRSGTGGGGRACCVPDMVCQLGRAAGRRPARDRRRPAGAHRRSRRPDQSRGRHTDRHLASAYRSGSPPTSSPRSPISSSTSRSRSASGHRYLFGRRPASSRRSRHGTIRCTSSQPSSHRRLPRAARRSSSRPASHRSARSCWPRSSTSSACRPAR